MSIAEGSCSSSRGPLWQKLPFLPEPPTPGFNPTEWSLAQYESYVKSTILQATAVAIAFVGIAVVLFLFLLLWRMYGWIKFCCSACCGVAPRNTRRKSLLAYEVMHDPWLRGHKVAYAFFAMGCVILAATGLVTLPRPLKQANDLAARLEAASAFTTSLLDASDGLLGASANVRPVMSNVATALQPEDLAGTVESDIQCVSTLLDGGLARPAALRAQISAATSSISVGLIPMIAAASALINATLAPAPDGFNPSMTVVEGMLPLISTINSTLGAYDNAIAALPGSRSPFNISDPGVTALQTAQGALNISGWLNQLDLLTRSLPTVAAASWERHYDKLGAAVQALATAATAAAPTFDTLAVSLVALDTLYLGPAQQPQQQPSGTVAGRPCMLSLAQELSDFESFMFSFNSSLERSAINTTLTVKDSLEQIYGVGDDAASAVQPKALNDTVVGTALEGMQLPVPLATPPLQAQPLLASLNGFNVTDFVRRCNVIQNFSYQHWDGATAVPDLTPLQSRLAAVRSTLVALQRPSDGVQAALTAYRNFQSDSLYGALVNTANNTKTALADARAAATPILPPGSYRMASDAQDTAVWFNASVNYLDIYYRRTSNISMTERLRILRRDGANLTNWITASNGGGAVLNTTSVGLARIQAALSKAQALLNQSGWITANAAATASAAATPTGSSSSPLPPSPSSAATAVRPSTFLQPLLTSMEIIASTVSDGLAAVADQLDNALGKALTSPSPPPPPAPPSPANSSAPPPARHRRRQLQQSSSSSSGPGNVTTVVRQQVVHRLEDLTTTLRGPPVRRYSEAAYFSAVAFYCCVIIVCLLLGVAMYFNYHAGLVLGLLLHLLLATLMLVCAWAAAGTLVVAHDTCGNVDSLVLEAVSPSSPLFGLVRYYLQGIGGSLASVLRTTGLGDTARLTAAANALQALVLNPLLLPQPPDPVAFAVNSTSPWPGSLGNVQATLGALLIDLAALASDMSAQLTSLLTLGDRSVVLAQYGAVTSWACCGLGGQLLVAWVCATGCGLLACLAGLSGLMVLKNLDDMPVHKTCNCACYNPKDYPKPVRRRRYSSSGGGFGSCGSPNGIGSCGRGGGYGSDGGAVRVPPLSYPPPVLIPNPPVPSRAYSGSSPRANPPTRSPDFRSFHGSGSGGGGPVATAAATLDFRSPPSPGHGKASSRREMVVEGPLYHGPQGHAPPPAPISSSSSPRSMRPGPPIGGVSGLSSTSGSRRPPPGSSMNIMAMDPETARAFGYGGSERESGGGGGWPSPRPSPRMSPRMSPSRPAPPPPFGSPRAYRIPEQWPQ